jgi:hypothetical protein
MLNQAASLSDRLGSAGTKDSSLGELSISFYALLAWVVLVTVAVIITAIVTYRRWGRHPRSVKEQETSRGEHAPRGVIAASAPVMEEWLSVGLDPEVASVHGVNLRNN